jgi:hypothetical protein
MSRTDDLADCIDKILRDYPKDFVTDDLFETDQIRIRRRGPGPKDFKSEDVVGTYNEADYEDGRINETSIRTDVQNWLQHHGTKI